MRKKSKIPILTLIFSLCFMVGCVSPGAIKAQLSALSQEVSQKADNDVVAEQIGQVNNRIEQTTKVADNLLKWQKSIKAETINYGGASHVMIGLILMTIVFLSAIGLFITWGFKKYLKYKNMLSLVTMAVHKASPDVQKEIKRQIKRHAANGDKSQAQHKSNLAKHCRKDGVFAIDG